MQTAVLAVQTAQEKELIAPAPRRTEPPASFSLSLCPSALRPLPPEVTWHVPCHSAAKSNAFLPHTSCRPFLAASRPAGVARTRRSPWYRKHPPESKRFQASRQYSLDQQCVLISWRSTIRELSTAFRRTTWVLYLPPPSCP
eukprot:1019139-Rhodomonas_salina.1